MNALQLQMQKHFEIKIKFMSELSIWSKIFLALRKLTVLQ